MPARAAESILGPGSVVDGLRETWRVHDEINLFLLTHMPEAGFAARTLLKTGKPSIGRTVADVFVHMHEVRASHVKRGVADDIPRFESDARPSRQQLQAAFRASGRGVEQQLLRYAEQGERLKHRSGIVLLGYLISHDAHHRGQILLALKQSGVSRPEPFRFTIWEHWFRPKPEIADALGRATVP